MSNLSETDKVLADEKKRREEEEARRREAVGRINTFYGLTPEGFTLPDGAGFAEARANALARQQGYGRVHDNTMGLYNLDIARNHGDTARNMRFGLARQGLAGGSADVDAMSTLADTFARSVAQANRQADSQVAGMRSADENTRADLIARINAGLDADSAASIAANRAGANYAKEIAQPAFQLDNLFNGLNSFWGNYQQGLGVYNGNNRPVSQGSPVGGYGGTMSRGN